MDDKHSLNVCGLITSKPLFAGRACVPNTKDKHTMNTDKSTKLKRVNFVSESESLAKMEVLASERNTSLSHIIREAISLYLKQNGEAAK
jgi:hypothetical protein